MSKELEAFERLKEGDSPSAPRDIEIVEKALKEYEMEHTLRIRLENANYELVRKEQENEKMLNIFKNALTLEKKQVVVLPKDHSEDILGYSIRTLTEIKQSELDNDLKKELREWVLKNAFPNEIEALDTIKELFDFDFALRYPNNQPMLMITNKKTKEYWELPISKETQDLLKEVLL